MVKMILQMSAIVVCHVVLTVFLKKKFPDRDKIGRTAKVGLGIVYGLLAVISTYFSIEHNHMLLSVRDLSPLCAGLFLDPVSGIIAGVIGGIGRYIFGTVFRFGSITALGGSIATFLAGICAFLLHRFYFDRKNPPASDALIMGATMEVIHMYAVIFTSSFGGTSALFSTINVNGWPMIIITGLGLFAAAFAVNTVIGAEGALKVYGKVPAKEVQVSEHVIFWMLYFIFSLFFFNLGLSYGLQGGKAADDARAALETSLPDIAENYERMTEQGLDPAGLHYHVGTKGGFNVIDPKGLVTAGEHAGEKIPKRELKAIREHDYNKTFETDLFGKESMCRTRIASDKNLIAVSIPLSDVYENRRIYLIQTVFSNILMLSLIMAATTILLRRIVGDKLAAINESLHRITGGDLDEVVDVHSSLEFDQLSNDINQMVDALKGYIDAAEKRVEQELLMAKTIQDSALPHNFTFPRKDFSIFATMNPAKEVGGDFYDFFFVDNDHLALVIADVSGKGIPAAMFMMRAKTAIRTMAEKGGTPKEILTAANLALCEGNDARMFLTTWLGIVDLNTGLMTCSNAGHEYPVLMRKGEDFDLYKDPHTPVLALVRRAKPKEYELKLSPGDRLFVYTDGIPEAINKTADAYGTDRLLSVLNQTKDLPLDEALPAVSRDIYAFADGAEQFDDITMLGFEYLGEGSTAVRPDVLRSFVT